MKDWLFSKIFNIIISLCDVGGWMQSCTECRIFNRWLCNHPHHEETASHMGYCSHAHWNLQIPSLVSFLLLFYVVSLVWDSYMINSILRHGWWYRSDVIEIETWCQGEGRIGTRRDWILKDHATGQVIGRATRCILSYSFFFTSFPLHKRLIR